MWLKFKKFSRIELFILLFFLMGVIVRVWISQPTWLHYDENYYINIAQNYSDRRLFTPTMWRLGDINILAGGGSGYGIILLLNWLKIVGYSVFWGRMLNIILNICSGVILYYTAKLWWQDRSAGYGALIFSLVSTTSVYSFILKMDALAVLVYCAALFVFSYAEKKDDHFLHALVGFLLIIGAEFHILSTIYLFGFAFYYTIDFILSIYNKKKVNFTHKTVFFFGGALFFGLIYLIIHVLPNPAEYFFISNHCFECNESILLTEFKRIIRLIVFRPIDLIILIFVVITALIRKRGCDLKYLAIFAGCIIGQAVISPPPYAHYFHHLWPIIALGVGGYTAKGLKENRNKKMRAAIITILGFILLISNLVFYILESPPYLLAYTPSYSRSVSFIRSTLPNDAVIMGKVEDFYALREYRDFLSYRDGTIYGIELRNENMIDFWESVNIDAILLDFEILSEDKDLITYIKNNNFIKIYSDLWIKETFIAEP